MWEYRPGSGSLEELGSGCALESVGGFRNYDEELKVWTGIQSERDP